MVVRVIIVPKRNVGVILRQQRHPMLADIVPVPLLNWLGIVALTGLTYPASIVPQLVIHHTIPHFAREREQFNLRYSA